MDYFKFYSVLPIAVQNWIVELYSYKIKRERRGRDYSNILAFLKSTNNWTQDHIISYKEEYISKILKQAYNHCPYYQKKYNAARVSPDDFKCLDDLQKFPILTKEEVRANLAGLVADNVKSKDKIHYHTSGTSGKALDFYNSKYNLQYYWAVCSRYVSRFDLKPHSESLNFTGKLIVPINQVKPPYWRYKKAQNQYMLAMQHITREKVPAIVNFINQEDFQYITGYPSIIYSFCQFVDELGLTIAKHPVYYFTGAEKVYDYQADLIEKVFSKLQIVEHYGFSENAGAASKCVYNHYHEDFELGHFELNEPVIDGNLSTGILLATGFHNYAMPFIRYEVGDTVTFENVKCDCGLNSQVIREINGRNEDYIITPEGAHIMRFDYIFKNTKTIKECQVVQKKIGEVCLKIVKRDNYSNETEQELIKNIRTMISPTIEISFEYVDEIPRTKAGKFKAVVSELSK